MDKLGKSAAKRGGSTVKMESGSLDRRAVYTCHAIKEAFLAEIKVHSFSRMTISSLCRRAAIQRSTFYLHYKNLNEVLDSLIDEALLSGKNQEDGPQTLKENFKTMKDLIRTNRPLTELERHDWLLPACQRMAANPRYRCLLQDETLSGIIIDRIYCREKESMIPFLQEQGGLSKEEADRLFIFFLYGSFYVNRSMQFRKDRLWYQLQGRLLAMVLNEWPD
jgi:AcrR family transcriptional regulator